MKEDILFQIFSEDTSGKNYDKGIRVLNNDLISSIDINTDNEVINIEGNVISENLFNEYRTKIKIDTINLGILSTLCSCIDYEQHGYKKRNYCCKHLVATFYKAAEEVASHPLLKAVNEESKITSTRTNALDMLLGDEDEKDQIKIDIYINKNSWTGCISAEFRIGLKVYGPGNLYILKDINQFLFAYQNNVTVEYSKNFIYKPREQRLDTKDKRLMDFILNLKELEDKNKFAGKGEDKYIEGKNINIPGFLTRSFFEIIKRHKIYLNDGFFSRPVETEIVQDKPYIDFDLKSIKNSFVLKAPSGIPMPLGRENDVFVYGTTVYLPDYEFCYNIIPYLELLNERKVVTIPGESGSLEEERVLRRLIPKLNRLSSSVTLSKSIKDKIVAEAVQFNFYFNKEDGDIVLNLKVKYGPFEFMIFEDFREKVIYRDTKKEQQVVSTLRMLGFEEIKERFHLLLGDDYVFRFFKSEVARLQEIGEVYYSENFRGIRSIGTKGIKADIKSGKFNYFEMDFKIGDLSKEDTAGILKAFRDNVKYYRLKNGEFLDLEEIELRKFLKLLDVVSPWEAAGNHIEILKNKGAYISEYIEANDMRYVKGSEELTEVSNRLRNIESMNFQEPKELQGTLREYQRAGYKWLKTLDYLGFGGILGDEMGLGKTLQTISFILSNKDSKSLIVTPTSLIYNWISEFERFAPGISIAVVNGQKGEREEIISNTKKYDVVITTYNLLKRDLESYNSMEFDYLIIDEAQYIKNHNSQNATAVKSIKARTRFALTGTPIENSLMELWSIFDFIMPGYLYDEKRFSVRYHKRLSEEPEVINEINKLIKPFILRRRKKEVISELPNKIEKKLIVPLNDEQKLIYGTYARHVKELIEDKVKEDEFKNSRIEILSYITRLRQLCLDPSIIMKDYKGGSGKIEALMELIEQSMEEGHRMLIFSAFTTVLKSIGEILGNKGIAFSYLDGKVPSEKRMDIVNDFNKGENSIFLISLKAGGTGLNLTSADIVIHFDPWWNPAVEDQATDRAHRIGQRNVVEVIKIIAKGTIEERVVMLQEEKRKLISELMGENLSGGEALLAFSQEELLELFEVHQ